MHRNESSVISTLCYSDIFDYPLTKAEIWRYLFTTRSISFSSFSKVLDTSVQIKEKNGLYFLPRRNRIIQKRQERERISEKKLQKNLNILHYLGKIPTIELLGISGSLAMRNAEKNADIDIFLITKQNTLWITRLFTLFLLEIAGKRRKRGDKKSADKICVNMLIDSQHLSFSKRNRDIYTAHEIAQMKIVVSKNNMHERFLFANAWVRSFLPNSIHTYKIEKVKKKHFSFFEIFEPIAKVIQLPRIKRHTTKEIVTNGFVAFHPHNYKKQILEAFETKRKQYAHI